MSNFAAQLQVARMLKWQVVAQTREQYRGPDSPLSQSHHAENQSLNTKLPCKEALRHVVIAPWQKHTHSSQFSCCQPSTRHHALGGWAVPLALPRFFFAEKDCTFSAEKISAKMERIPPSPSAGSALPVVLLACSCLLASPSISQLHPANSERSASSVHGRKRYARATSHSRRICIIGFLNVHRKAYESVSSPVSQCCRCPSPPAPPLRAPASSCSPRCSCFPHSSLRFAALIRL